MRLVERLMLGAWVFVVGCASATTPMPAPEQPASPATPKAQPAPPPAGSLSPPSSLPDVVSSAGRSESALTTSSPNAGTTKVTSGKHEQGTSNIECDVPIAGPGLVKVKTTIEPDCVTEPNSELEVRWREKTLSVRTIVESVPLKGRSFDSEVFELPPRGARLALHFKAKCVGSTELTQGIGRCRMP